MILTDLIKAVTYWMLRISGIFLLAISLWACDDDYLVNQTQTIPNESWQIEDTLVFPFEISDTVKAYDLYINLRHSVDYSYQNLFVFVSTYFPENTMHRDTIEFVLASPQGEWLGEGFGRLKYNTIAVRKGLIFPDTGSYRFVFRHAMRADTLMGIRDVGVQIKESKQTADH